MNRRAFVVGLGAVLAAPLGGEAQQAGRIYRVGFVGPASGLTAQVLAFHDGLRDNGLVEGQNVAVDQQLMGGREDQYTVVLAELERRVDVIVSRSV